MKKRLISAVLLFLCQFDSMLGNPGIIDSPEIKKRAISTKLSSFNSIESASNSAEKSSGTAFDTIETSNFQPIHGDFEPLKITHEDVVTGGKSNVYGSHSQFSNGGIIFAIEGVPSTPLMSAAHPQPVLLQYLTPEGTPKQTAVQYVQILRPLMVVPSQHYLQTQSASVNIQTEATPINANPTSSSSLNPYGGTYLQPSGVLIGAHSAPLTSYIPSAKSQQLSVESDLDISLNMNEYVPAASSRASTSIPTPQVTNSIGFRPSKFSMIAQRA